MPPPSSSTPPAVAALRALLDRILDRILGRGRRGAADTGLEPPADRNRVPPQDDHRLAVGDALEPRTVHWLESLPETLQIVTLRGEFPRVLNKLALVWDDRAAFDATLESLLLDDRIARQGFPFEALKELTAIRELRDAQPPGEGA